jgi:hypothetical protein
MCQKSAMDLTIEFVPALTRPHARAVRAPQPSLAPQTTTPAAPRPCCAGRSSAEHDSTSSTAATQSSTSPSYSSSKSSKKSGKHLWDYKKNHFNMYSLRQEIDLGTLYMNKQIKVYQKSG